MVEKPKRADRHRGAPKARHRLTLLPFDSQSEDAIRLIIEASRSGSVLVVVNEVRRAIQRWDRLRQDVRPHLLHSRYHFADRAAIADIILLKRGLRVLHRGILEGRKAFGNVMKYLLMGTSSNFGNMFSMAAASVFLKFLPMLPPSCA